MSRSHTRATRAALLCAAGLLSATALPTPAQAAAPAWYATVYDVVPRDATDTYPDYVSFERTGGDPLPAGARVVLRLERAGAVIAIDSSPSTNYASVYTPELRAGDVARLVDSKTGAEYATLPVDGRPSYSGFTCAGQATLDGYRTPGASITDVTAYRWSQTRDPGDYGGSASWWQRTELNPGRIDTLAGEQFSGTFRRPLTAGMIVSATSTNNVSDGLTVLQTVERVVGACPQSPGVPQTAVQPGLRDGSAPQAKYTAPSAKTLKKVTLKRLQSPGLRFAVTSSEVGTVAAALSYRRSSKKQPVQLTSVTVPVKAGAATTVTLKLPKSARKKLKRLPKGAKLIASFRVTDAAGNVTTLKPLTFAVPKR